MITSSRMAALSEDDSTSQQKYWDAMSFTSDDGAINIEALGNNCFALHYISNMKSESEQYVLVHSNSTTTCLSTLPAKRTST
jgi:hypothetical protein